MSSSSSASSSSSSDLPKHSHSHGKCPFADTQGRNPHAFCPPQEGDSRAPCPALNTMANHGYLPRNGQGITADLIIKALKECYALSSPLSWFLTHGALTLLGQSTRFGKQMCLYDLARHNGVEHDASLYHKDADGDEYAPIHGDSEMLAQFFADSTDGRVMTPLDVARVRARRETTYSNGLDFIHAELARGEMGIVLNLFNNPNPQLHAEGAALAKPSLLQRLLRRKQDPKSSSLAGVPCELLRYWFEHERLPDGWTPYHKTTLRQTISTVNTMRSGMRKYAKELKSKGEAQAVTRSSKIQATLPSSTADAVTELEAEPVPAEDGQSLEAPPLSPSLISSTSATSTDFPETPQTSEFMPPLQGQGGLLPNKGLNIPGVEGVYGGEKARVIDGLPRISEPENNVLTA